MNTKNKLIMTIVSFIIVSAGIISYISLNTNQLASPVFYVANAGDGSVSEVDFEQNEPVASIPLETEDLSHGIALSTDKQTLYYGTGFQGKSLRAMNLETNETSNEIQFDEGVHGIDIHPSGDYLYVSLMAGLGVEGGTLAVIDTTNFTEITRIQTDDGPAHVDVSNNGEQVWVANVNGNSVSAIDAFTFQVLATIPVGDVPNEVALSPLNDYAYAGNVESNTLSVIDMETFEVVAEIEVGEGVHGVTVTNDGKQVWTANNHSNDVSVIDTDTLSVIETIDTDSYPNHISFSPEGNLAFVTHRESNTLVIIDQNDYSIVDEMELGSEPHEMTLKGMVNNESTTSDDTDVEESNERTLMDGEASADNVVLKAQVLSPYHNETKSLVKEETGEESFNFFTVIIDMETHSGDLSSIRFADNLVLTSTQGIESPVTQWVELNQDSHHPKYLALFEKTSDKQPLLMKPNDQLSLRFDPFINDSLEIIMN